MFTAFTKTPEDYFKSTANYFSQFPKNEKELKKTLEKVKSVLMTESENNKEMWNTFAKAARGDATVNEIADANKKAQALMTTARFTMLLSVPGSLFILPAIVDFAKQHNVDLVPASVAQEFGI